MRFFALLTAGLVALADAYTQPTGPLKGNPIYTPGLNQIVHKGSPFKITWNPTTKGTVTLVLLRGPSNNVKPLYAIAQKIPNNGHHLWTPKMNLEVDSTHYGLQLIVDHNGQYQYSTQFGIGKKKAGADADEVTELHIANFDDEPTYSTEVVTEYTTYCPSATTVPMGNTTYTVTEPTSLTITNCPCTITHSGTPSAPTYVPPMNTTSHGPYPTYTPPHNATSSHSSSSSSSKHTTSHTISKYTTHHVTSHATTPATTKTPAGPTSSSPAPTTTAPSSANAVKLGMGFVAGAAGLAAAMAGL